MFRSAIRTAAQFVRPIYTIEREFETNRITPGAVSLFFINENGDALTAKHVATMLPQAEKLADVYDKYRAECKQLNAVSSSKKRKKKLSELKRKYRLKKGKICQVRCVPAGCVAGPISVQVELHPKYDLALMRFRNFEKLLPVQFPIFPKDSLELQSGKFLCRLGFPFAEFKNYAYDPSSDDIVFTDTGKTKTPYFPLEGMVTRTLIDDEGKLFGVEMSTPGLRGQSGGPLFDERGFIYGMQFATNHHYLGFDVRQQIRKEGRDTTIEDSAFLHVGLCIHLDVIKDFLRTKNVSFQEEP